MTALRSWFAVVCVLLVCGLLLGSIYIQFVQGEMPCPLCVLQRVALTFCAAGPASLLALSRRRDISPRDFCWAYGSSSLAAVFGIAVAVRHVLLHIAPGDPGYGEPIFGFHLYTWGFFANAAVLVVGSLQLMFLTPESSERWSLKSVGTFVFGLLALITLVNALSVFAEAGWHPFLPDNPTGYRLLKG